MRSRNSVITALLGAVLAACSSGAAPTATPSGSPSTAAPVVSIKPTGTPTATQQPLPAALIGRWEADFGNEDVVTLDIDESGYSIARETSAKGSLELDDGAMVFSQGTICAGEGRYAWTLKDKKLHLEVIGADACPGRQTSLDGATYVRVE